MPNVAELLNQAVRHHQSGQLDVAEKLYRQILQADPQNANAWRFLGVLAKQAGRYDIAAEYIRQALRLRPDNAEAHNLLGNILSDLGQNTAAETCYRQAVRLKPDYSEAHNNLGILLHQQGKLEEASAAFKEALRLQPDLAETYHNLAAVLKKQGKWDEAKACYQEVLRLKPDNAQAHNNLGNIYREQGNSAAAEACYRQALRIKPDYPEAHNNLGNVLRDLGKLEAAGASFQAALRYRSNFAEAHINLGNVLMDQGQLEQAETSFHEALRLKPDDAEAHNNLGNVFLEEGRLTDAEACYQKALRLQPALAEAHNNLGNVFKHQGRVPEAIACYRQALALQPDFAQAASNVLYLLNFSPDYDASAIFEEHRRWNSRFAEPLSKLILPHANLPAPERRLRIGYVSPDFCNHAESFFTVPLLSAHDHQHFEIFCYADVVRPDDITARLRSYTDAWRNIKGLTDEQAAHMVRQDGIDILVDLTMHMARNRLLVFARKPAPVQVCWLAYQGTTGLGTMDYRLTDETIDPPGLYDQYYSEESVRLADAFWCYDPLASGPPVSPMPVLHKGYITFGCLNNFCKVNVPVLKLWAKVLRTVPGSQLVLLAAEGSHRQHTLDLLKQEGAAPERVTFVAKLPRPRYLELYQGIDIGLDTFPYTGQTTSLDAFWLGVPVVTLVGQTAVARAGKSLLEKLGLPELIADTPEGFVSIAVALAGAWPRLRDLRASLRERLRQSPLMDAPRFARNVEAAYRTMWRRWCRERGVSSPESEDRS